MNGTKRIRGDKLGEHQYIERYARDLESKTVEWKEDRNDEQM